MFHFLCRGGLAACLISAATLSACAELSPVGPQSRVGDRKVAQLVLALDAPCSLSPGGAPMGRPDGVRGHTLPAGRYPPTFEDERGIFFASPNGIVVTEPAPLGTRARPGGIYLPSDGAAVAEEYLGDEERVTLRYRLPEHCRYSLQNAAAPATPG